MAELARSNAWSPASSRVRRTDAARAGCDDRAERGRAARLFGEDPEADRIVLAKLDSTAKGGIVPALKQSSVSP